MRRTILVVAFVLAAVGAWAGERSRTFTSDQPAAGLTEVVLEGGVGEVEVFGTASDRIELTATASASRSGFWSTARGRRALEEVKLNAEVRGSILHLSLELPDEDDDDHELGEEWTVRMPAQLALSVEFGVGEVGLVDLRGNVGIEVGVGEIHIEGAWNDFGPVNASCGVGDVELRSPDGREDGEGFISRSLRSRGPGKAEIDIRAGVGDVTIKLR